MIDLVLQQLRGGAVEPLPRLLLARVVAEPDRYGFAAGDADEKKRETHAVVPEGELARVAPDDDRVDHGPGTAIQVQGDESLRHSDLGRGDGAAEAVRLTKVLEGGGKRLAFRDELLVLDVVDRRADLAEARIADEQDSRCGQCHKGSVQLCSADPKMDLTADCIGG